MASKYAVVEYLYWGRHSVVSVVHSHADGKAYVMKEIVTLASQQTVIQRAVFEVSFLAILGHPHVIEYNESFVDDGRAFIIMEHATGGSLDAVVKSRRAERKYFSEVQVLDWFAQVVSAMAFLHARLIIHRDIKSRNVFISGDGRLKVGDFGIAAMLEDKRQLLQEVIGTPISFSPELALRKPYGLPVDMWALGCLLYELCSLKHPFKGKTKADLYQHIVEDETPSIPSNFSSRIQKLINALMDKDPRRRPDIERVTRVRWVAKRLAQLEAKGGSNDGPSSASGSSSTDHAMSETKPFAREISAQTDYMTTYKSLVDMLDNPDSSSGGGSSTSSSSRFFSDSGAYSANSRFDSDDSNSSKGKRSTRKSRKTSASSRSQSTKGKKAGDRRSHYPQAREGGRVWTPDRNLSHKDAKHLAALGDPYAQYAVQARKTVQARMPEMENLHALYQNLSSGYDGSSGEAVAGSRAAARRRAYRRTTTASSASSSSTSSSS